MVALLLVIVLIIVNLVVSLLLVYLILILPSTTPDALKSAFALVPPLSAAPETTVLESAIFSIPVPSPSHLRADLVNVVVKHIRLMGLLVEAISSFVCIRMPTG